MLVSVDGASAVFEFEQRHASIACALVDLTMPGMHGLVVVLALRRRNPDQPIIALSSLIESDQIEAIGTMAPAVDCLTKPLAMAPLLRVIAAAVGAARR